MKKFILIVFVFGFVNICQAQIEKNVGDFTSLKTSNRIKVELIPSDQNKVIVNEGQEDAVNITNKNGRLILKNTLKELVSEEKYSVTVQVYFNNLENIDAQGGSYIYSQKPIQQNNLKLSVNLGSVVVLDVKTESLTATANTGAKLTLTGTVKNSVQLKASAGAQITANDLITSRNKVTVNSGSIASVTASDYLDAQVFAGGKVRIFGTPKDVKEKVTAGGIIERVK